MAIKDQIGITVIQVYIHIKEDKYLSNQPASPGLSGSNSRLVFDHGWLNSYDLVSQKP